MKIKKKCIGCGMPKLVNKWGLCKKCNKQASKYLSRSEIEKIKKEEAAQEEAQEMAKKQAEEEKEAKAKEKESEEKKEENESKEEDK